MVEAINTTQSQEGGRFHSAKSKIEFKVNLTTNLAGLKSNNFLCKY